MIPIQLLAAYLLLGRIVSDFFIILVLRRQWRNRKVPAHPKVKKYRRILNFLAISIFLLNIYPIYLDLITIFDPGVRTSLNVKLSGAAYSVDNNLAFVLASICIWVMYKISDTITELAELLGKSDTINADKSSIKRKER